MTLIKNKAFYTIKMSFQKTRKLYIFLKGINALFWSKLRPFLPDLFFLRAGLDMNVDHDLDQK